MKALVYMGISMFAGIIIDISHEKLDRIFEYAVPEEMLPHLRPGMTVMVPFGKGNTLRKGYVVELREKAEYPVEQIKSIQEICEKSITLESKLLALAGWMKHQYGSTMVNCLKTVLPVKQKKKAETYKYVETIANQDELDAEIAKCNRRTNAARIKLLEELKRVDSIPLSIVQDKLAVSVNVVKTLEKHGIVRIREERQYRNPRAHKRENIPRHILNPEQQAAVDGISAAMERGESQVSLLYGVTGSGKTEVYMELIERAIEKGQQAIVLIPEIALTFQTLMRFYERFGDRVSVVHSRLSEGERYDQYERAKKGELDIIIGPRSALFIPFPRLGMIVIDEEHESSYKSEKMPKYHAREVAEYIVKRENAQLVLGSATPSLESYYRAQKGEYRLYRLQHRNGTAVLPAVNTVDMRQELKEGNRSYFSRELKERLTEVLTKGQQAMLFINRRGYAGFVSCRECGYVLKCPHCEVSLSQHGTSGKGTMVCHYCGYEMPQVSCCPECGSKYIAGFRAGTERMEQELKKEYPSIRVLRMDADTTKKKEDYDRILSAFANNEADVLVGTQMIVKGHDFPNVTLVGILAADLSLFSADYRSAERCFQLAVQACGRAGRGDKKGHVVIQTYKPEHYSIKHAAKQDYDGFYEEEIVYRSMLGYPPAGHMLAVQIFAVEEHRAEEVIHDLAALVKHKFSQNISLVGPAKAVFSKIRDVYRMVFYLKSEDYSILVEAKDLLEAHGETHLTPRENLQFDFDPMGMF